jgi:predicted esterase
MCGAGDPAQVARIGRTPVWLFHGGRDPLVRPEWSLATAEALDRAGGDVRVTVHEDLTHDCWTRVYGGQDLYDWFLSHARG